jgi:hypothetical protein
MSFLSKNAVDVFNVAACNGDILGRLAGVLRNRTFGEKHFESARAFVEKLSAGPRRKILEIVQDEPQKPLRERRLLHSMIYVVPKSETEKNEQVAAISHLAMADSFLFFFNRPLPLQYRYFHLMCRYEQRMNADMDFMADPFVSSQTLTVALARVMEKRITDGDGANEPVVIPHPDGGLFLGDAAPVGRQNFDFMNVHTAMHENTASTLRYMEEVQWSPNMMIIVRTIIDAGMFDRSRRALYSELMSFQNTHSKALWDIFCDYCAGSPSSIGIPDLREMYEKQRALEALEAIINGPHWRREVALFRERQARRNGSCDRHEPAPGVNL